ncbi:MAG: MBOAT family protein [Flavobacteriales bacterium]|nr:MBOAT family protein [Flavobacteriales bacterium]
MIFNSLTFFIFLPLVLALYILLRKNRIAQNILLLASSYFFYGWWDYRFLGLIAFSTVIDYYCGLKINESSERKVKKTYLYISIFTNLGLLWIFKYFNFFADSFSTLANNIGLETSPFFLDVILPVGISFYTFQTLSYSIDIYRGKLNPTKDFISFASFVSFFPQLVAGPIERASHLLPQFTSNRETNFQNIKLGLQFFIWGLFKKVVVADNLAEYVNIVFENQETFGGINNLLATFFFAFQIYCDFSGYSSMAIGLAKMFGFNLNKNFNTPYFSTSLKEFWQRWHISLSSWFRDYVYIILGGNKVSKGRYYLNILITFIVSGIWHGANWTFIIWGSIHGLFYLLENIWNKDKIHDTFFKKIIGLITTFSITSLAWVFFRSNSFSEAISFISNIPSMTYSHAIKPYNLIIELTMIGLLIILDYAKNNNTLRTIYNQSLLSKWSFYLLLVSLIILFGNTRSEEFIYFQF